MKPIYNPPISEMNVQGILYALSDPVRVRIFVELMNASAEMNCTSFLKVNESRLPKSTLSLHFKVLREAGLVFSQRKGVELQNHTRCAEYRHKFGPLIAEILKAYQDAGVL